MSRPDAQQGRPEATAPAGSRGPSESFDESVPRLGLEDLSVGQKFMTLERTIREEDIVSFATDFDPQPFHLDPAAATKTYFRGLAGSGWHIGALTMGLLVTSGLPLAGGIIGAGAEIRWPSASRPGDVLHVEVTVMDITPSRSKPDRGIVSIDATTVTRQGLVRQRMVAKLLVFRKSHPTQQSVSS